MACWLVTGGRGFIGSHLVQALLERGDRVRVLDDLSNGTRHEVLDGAEIVVGDVADRDLLTQSLADADGCFHLAAVASVLRSNEDWHGALHSNVTGTIEVFEAARSANPHAPIPVVYASSAAVYGDNPLVPLAETAATSPLTTYGAHKLLCELYAQIAWSVHRLPTTGLRFFNVYGPRQDPRSSYAGVISIFADRIAAGHGIEIFGDGRQVRDFIYVGDTVSHLLAAMARLRTGALVLNVCSGRGTSVLELVDIIAAVHGRPSEICFRAPRAGEIRVSIGDPTAAASYFGFTAETRIEEGLRRMIGGRRT
jgi:UDP-glucose 4-epimerase